MCVRTGCQFYSRQQKITSELKGFGFWMQTGLCNCTSCCLWQPLLIPEWWSVCERVKSEAATETALKCSIKAWLTARSVSVHNITCPRSGNVLKGHFVMLENTFTAQSHIWNFTSPTVTATHIHSLVSVSPLRILTNLKRTTVKTIPPDTFNCCNSCFLHTKWYTVQL